MSLFWPSYSNYLAPLLFATKLGTRQKGKTVAIAYLVSILYLHMDIFMILIFYNIILVWVFAEMHVELISLSLLPFDYDKYLYLNL